MGKGEVAFEVLQICHGTIFLEGSLSECIKRPKFQGYSNFISRNMSRRKIVFAECIKWPKFQDYSDFISGNTSKRKN